MIEKLTRGEGLFARFVCVFFALALAVSLTPVLPAAAFAATDDADTGQNTSTDPPEVQMLTTGTPLSVQDGELSGGETIDASGTYALSSTATDTITIGEELEVTIEGIGATKLTGLNIVVGDGSTLTIKNLYADQGSEASTIDFSGNGTLKIEGTNLIDNDGGLNAAVIHVAEGKEVHFAGTGTLYGYKSALCSYIGGSSDEANGKIVFDGGYWFLKGTKTGAVIGGDSTTVKGDDIVVNGGELYVKGIAKGALLGGSNQGLSGDVYINGGLVELYEDFSGPAIGAGQEANAGNVYVTGGSLKTTLSSNSTNSYGESATFGGMPGVSWAAVKALNASDYALLSFDVSDYITDLATDTVTVYLDGATTPFYSGRAYTYVTNEVKNPAADDTFAFSTMANWLPNDESWLLTSDNYGTSAYPDKNGSSLVPEKNLYFALSKENHTLTVGSDTYNVTWDADAAAFTCEKVDTPFVSFATDIADETRGTEEKPYRISTEEDLIAFQEAINADTHATYGTDTAAYTNKYFKLLNDIALTKAWVPVGKSTSVFFGGVFDGAGYTISNVTYASDTGTSSAHCALFGYVRNSVNGGDVVIKNLKVVGAGTDAADIVDNTTSTSSTVGGIIGYANPVTSTGVSMTAGTVTIDNCVSDINLKGGRCVGGIVGQANKCVSVTNCLALGDIEAVDKSTSALAAQIGGIVGAYSTADTSVTVFANNLFLGQITATDGMTSDSLKESQNALIGKAYADVVASGNNHYVAQSDTRVGAYKVGSNSATAAADGMIVSIPSTAEEATALVTTMGWDSGSLVAQNVPVVEKTYAATAADAENGTVTLTAPEGKELTALSAGDTVSITATPSEDYQVASVSYTPEDGEEVTIEAVDGAYSFTMPAANVTVSVTFEEIPGYMWYTAPATEGSYVISDAEELAEFSNIVNGSVPEEVGITQDNFAGKTVTLAADIDLSEYADWAAIGGNASQVALTITSQEELAAAITEHGVVWDDQGAAYSGSTNDNPYSADRSYFYWSGPSFAGMFDGANHSITGLTITTGTGGYKGLFGGNSGTIKDLSVAGTIGTADSMITSGADNIGGLVGYNYGTVSGITGNVTVYVNGGIYAVGGIVGQNGDNGLVTQCINNANVTASKASGGVVGRNFGDITECVNTGTITGNKGGKDGIGGIAGYGGNKSSTYANSISQCYNTGAISNPSGRWYGGIVGFADSATTVTYCYNVGEIATGYSWNWNPICGSVDSAYASWHDNYSLEGLNAGDTTASTQPLTIGTVLTADEMKAASFVKTLNGGGEAFNKDTDSINSGYAILAWQGGTPAGYEWYTAPAAEGAYVISDAEELAEFANIVNGTVPEAYGVAQDNFSGKTVTLAADIAVAEDGLYTANANVTYGTSSYPMTTTQYVLQETAPIWTPIGSGTATNNTNATTANAFAGTFDGAGYTISGIYTGTTDATAGNTDTVQGLFGVVSGTVKNVTVSGCITGKIVVGGVVAHLAGGTVENCVNNAVVLSDGGTTPGAGTENGLKRGGATGGIVGNVMTGSSVTGCVNTGHIIGANTCKGGRVGGIIGLIDGSDYAVTVSQNGNTGAVEAYQYAAGIVGMDYSKAAPITECYNTGNITGYSPGSTYVGGIVSQCNSDVTACYNTGDIAIVNSGKAAHQGGIVSDLINSAATISNCYNTGNTAAGSSYGAICGTGYGTSSSNRLDNCYALADTGDKGEDVTNGCVTTVSADDIKAALFVAQLHNGTGAFNMDATGEEAINGGMPILAWQGGTAVYAVILELGEHVLASTDTLVGVVAGNALDEIVISSDDTRYDLSAPSIDPTDAGIVAVANSDKTYTISGTPTANVTVTIADATISSLGEALEAAEAAMEGVYVSDDGETAVVDGETVEVPVGAKYVSSSAYEAMAEVVAAAQAICDDPASSDMDKSNAAWTVRMATSTFKTSIKLAQIPVLDQAAADEVIAMIEALPEAADVTADDSEAIDEAQDAYDALTDDQKALVSDELTAKLAAAKSAADQAAADEVIAMIEALPEASSVSADDADAAEEALAAYEELTDDQKALVSEELTTKVSDVATAAEAAVEAEEDADQAAADAVSALIAALPDSSSATAADATAAAAAQAAYDALTDEQKALVSSEDLSKLSATSAAASTKAEAAAAEAALISVSKATITVAKATYTGKALKPTVTVKVNGKKLTANTDYTLTYVNNKKAGYGVVFVKGKGAYTDVAYKSFRIYKAKNTMTAKAKKATQTVKYSKLKKKNVIIKKAKAFKISKAKGTVTFKLASVPKKIKGKVAITTKGKITLTKGIKKGTYKVKVKVTAAGNANFKKLTKTVTFKIKVK